jgi:hypothetical protein
MIQEQTLQNPWKILPYHICQPLVNPKHIQGEQACHWMLPHEIARNNIEHVWNPAVSRIETGFGVQTGHEPPQHPL